MTAEPLPAHDPCVECGAPMFDESRCVNGCHVFIPTPDDTGECVNPDLAAGLAWWRFLTDSPDITLIGLDAIEGGILTLYDYAPGQRAAMRR